MDQDHILEVKIKTGKTYIDIYDIVFLRTKNRHCLVTMYKKEPIEIFHNIQWADQHLPQPQFCRCHNSYIINCDFFESINPSTEKIKLKGFGEIPVSRTRKTELVNNIKEYLSSNNKKLL